MNRYCLTVTMHGRVRTAWCKSEEEARAIGEALAASSEFSALVQQVKIEQLLDNCSYRLCVRWGRMDA